MTEQTPHPPENTPGRPRRFWLKRLFIVMVVVFLAMQMVPVDRHNPEVVADINAPEEVKSILRRACYDCHSNETHWPWYSYVAPGSWLMAKDVREGRNYTNFSEWGDYYDDVDTPEMFLDECWESIHTAEMPLWFYLPLHPEAKLTEEDLAVLSDWCGAEPVELDAEDVAETIEEKQTATTTE